MSAHADKKESFSIQNTTKGKLPSLPFLELKESILGKNYTLSCVFVGDALSKKLNRTYRGKNKPTNVLSFPLSKTEGEIFLNLKLAKKEAPKFEEKYKNFVGFLFIHGLLHLKGLDHGSRMERAEKLARKKFGI
jgi:probable rRNA maturation factor